MSRVTDQIAWTSIPIGPEAVVSRHVLGTGPRHRWLWWLCWFGHPAKAYRTGDWRGVACTRCGTLSLWQDGPASKPLVLP